MAGNEEDKIGSVKIADEVIAVCVLRATLKTNGVHALSGRPDRQYCQKFFLARILLTKGIKVSQSEEGILIDVSVIVNYGVKIPAVAWDIQENVKDEVENIVDMNVLRRKYSRNWSIYRRSLERIIGGDHAQKRSTRVLYANALPDGDQSGLFKRKERALPLTVFG